MECDGKRMNGPWNGAGGASLGVRGERKEGRKAAGGAWGLTVYYLLAWWEMTMCCSGVLKGVLCTRCNRPALLCAVRLSSRLTLSTHLPDTLPPSILTSASTHMQDPQRDGRLTADGGAALTVITIPLGPSPCLPPRGPHPLLHPKGHPEGSLRVSNTCENKNPRGAFALPRGACLPASLAKLMLL